MAQEQDKERAAFERWQTDVLKRCLQELTRGADAPGEYDDVDVHNEWIAWQARAAVAPQPNAVLADGWLNPEDMAALQRVDGMFQDGEGYDVPAPQMKRLAALGVLRHHSAGRYSITTFGQVVLGVECFRKPLETVDECNARLGREHRAKLGIPAPPTLNASKEGSHE